MKCRGDKTRVFEFLSCPYYNLFNFRAKNRETTGGNEPTGGVTNDGGDNNKISLPQFASDFS